MKNYLVINGIARGDYKWCSQLEVASKITGAELKATNIFFLDGGEGISPNQEFLNTMSVHGWDLVSFSESLSAHQHFHFNMVFSKESD